MCSNCFVFILLLPVLTEAAGLVVQQELKKLRQNEVSCRCSGASVSLTFRYTAHSIFAVDSCLFGYDAYTGPEFVKYRECNDGSNHGEKR